MAWTECTAEILARASLSCTVPQSVDDILFFGQNSLLKNLSILCFFPQQNTHYFYSIPLLPPGPTHITGLLWLVGVGDSWVVVAEWAVAGFQAPSYYQWLILWPGVGQADLDTERQLQWRQDSHFATAAWPFLLSSSYLGTSYLKRLPFPWPTVVAEKSLRYSYCQSLKYS